MRQLEFIGKVQADATPTLIIPGRADLFLAPEDWPAQLSPGTSTILVNDDGMPVRFAEIGHGEDPKRPDEWNFRPALVIPPRLIIGSTLKPDSDHPMKEFAQVWRANVQVLGTGQEAKCWMLRIIGSGRPSQIDLVAQKPLRAKMNLTDDTAVKVTIWEAESNEKPLTPEKIIADWCEAGRRVEDDFGIEKAMGYLIGEKFLNFLDVAETDREWRRAIPAFVAEIKSIFEGWRLSEFLHTPRRLGALGHTCTEEGHRMLREGLDQSEKDREDARNLMLLEWAKELLLEEAEA